MKRLFLLLAAVFAVTVVSAQTVSYEGDITVLKNPITYDLTVVYENLKVNDLPVDEFLPTMDEKFRNDWGKEIVPYAESVGKTMPMVINKKNVLDPNNPKYKFVLTLNSVSLGNVSGVFNPFTSPKSGGSVIYGSLEMFDAATNASVLVVKFDKVQGVSHFSDSIRWALAYVDLGNRLKKIVKKAK